MTKDKVLETIQSLPNEFNLEELIERLIFIDKIEKGRNEIREGKGIPHDKVKEDIKRW